MNSKTSAQVLYTSFVLLLLIVESLQTPISEDKRASHKFDHQLMRFGRNPHQLMHFGKRGLSDSGISSNEDYATNFINPVSNDPSNDQSNDLANVDQKEIIRYLFDQLKNSRNSEYPDNSFMTMERRSEGSRPFALPFTYPRKLYFKKADNRDNVFMHFG